VRRTVDRTLQLVAQELRMTGVARVTLGPAIEGGVWPTTMEKEGTWHHMGTTRMHDSPLQGVVDRDCRVHGMANLYIAGSSVFPTAGANFPTITIAALALRLAAHLLRQLQSFSSPLVEETEDKIGHAFADNQDLVTSKFGTPGLPAV
jgi:choline dehydrogenase-like flavoprotein